MGRFRIQILLSDNIRSTHYNTPKIDRNRKSWNDCTLVSLNFTVKNYANTLTYDERNLPHADMCFRKIMITHSVC